MKVIGLGVLFQPHVPTAAAQLGKETTLYQVLSATQEEECTNVN